MNPTPAPAPRSPAASATTVQPPAPTPVPPSATDAGGPSALDARQARVLREVRDLTGPWTFRRVVAAPAPAEPWLPASVPGCVHTDLLANRKIADPFYRLNEKDQQWIDKESWEYRTVIRADDALARHQRFELVFQGLDTYAEVSLDGVPLLRSTNMFRTWRVDVTDRLRAGVATAEHTLLVRFRSPILEVKPTYDGLGYTLPAANDQAPEMVSMLTRKAPYHYGWDWGPRFVTSGIWRPVALEAWSEARLDDVQVFQDHLDDATAQLTFKARVQALRSGPAVVKVALAGGGPPLATVECALTTGTNEISLPVRIDSPRRWWPNGLGAQHLYTFETSLSTGGTVRDQRRTRIGLRTLEVVHQRDKAGKSFTIKVNGAPVFMKGANWVPADSFLPRITPDRYRWLLQSAAAAHMNMVRVWGGGVYEDDAFYDLCDELGLLVWQDFMFACSMYPGDQAFVEDVHQEAVQNVRRLRNHPSLALWAGNNEIEAAWQTWGWPAKFHLSRPVQDRLWADYQALFHRLLPSVVTAEDPGRFYTRSSPSANEDEIPANKLGMGDMHYWGVWHAEEPYPRYAANTSRFMSEYGFQSFPDFATVARYTAPADWDIESPVMLAHQRHPRGNQLIRTYLQRDFRPPKDFGSFLFLGQVLQATVIQYAAEAHRRKMGHNWGSLYWQLDDCWPVASWSGIDYFGRWKALHYAARRFFAPILISVVEEGGKPGKPGKPGKTGPADKADRVEVWGISDRRTETDAHLTVRLLDLAGRELWRRDQDLRLLANASKAILTLAKREALAGADPAQVILVADLSEGGRRLSRSILSFVPTKDLDLPAPELHLEVESRPDSSFAVKVSARRFARSVFLTSMGKTGGKTPGVDGFFEDNHFDLLPGETVTVGFRPRTPVTLEAFRAELHVVSVVDTY